jgi:hypothetical protein
VAVVLAFTLLAACSDSEPEGDRLALDGASSTALLFWTTKGEGVDVRGAQVVEAKRDGDCYAVHLRGTDGGGGQIVALRRPSRGDPTIHGWEIVLGGDYSIDQLDGDNKNCGFN